MKLLPPFSAATRTACVEIFGLAAVMVLPLVAGCASQSSKIDLKATGPAKPTTATPYARVAVVAGVRRPEMRATVEDQVTASLRDRGITAESTYRNVPFEQLQQNPGGVAQQLASQGWPAVLVLRELDRATEDQDRPGGYENFALDPYIGMLSTDGEEMAIGGGYTPGYANAQTILVLEAKVRDLAASRGVWSAVCQATMGEDADRLEVLHRFADRLVGELSKAGLIR